MKTLAEYHEISALNLTLLFMTLGLIGALACLALFFSWMEWRRHRRQLPAWIYRRTPNRMERLKAAISKRRMRQSYR